MLIDKPAHSPEAAKVTHLDQHAIKKMQEMTSKDLASATFVVQVIEVKKFDEEDKRKNIRFRYIFSL